MDLNGTIGEGGSPLSAVPSGFKKSGTLMTRDEFIEFWGNSNLRRWPQHCLRDVAIPESSKSFLVEVGLPAFEDFCIEFDPHVGDLPRLPDRPEYRQIGFLYELVPICLNELANGCVFSIDGGPSSMSRYLNASVEQFAECLIVYVCLRRNSRLETTTESTKLEEQFERDMLKVDPTVFHDPDNFWAVIVEEMKYEKSGDD